MLINRRHSEPKISRVRPNYLPQKTNALHLPNKPNSNVNK